MKGREKLPIAFEKLRLLEGGDEGILVESNRVQARIMLVGADIYRIRAAAGRLGPDDSWAVIKGQKTTKPDVVTGKGVAGLRTVDGEIQVHLQTGVIEVRDCYGFEVFRSQPEATGFKGREARVGFRLEERDACFGLGATTGPINKRGLRKVLWNTDVLGRSGAIHPGVQSLYTSIPLLIVLRDGRASAVFWDNPARQTWDIAQEDQNGCHVKVAHGEINLYILLGPYLGDVLRQYTRLTGRMPMPPRWALGYHQCRYSYQSRTELEDIAAEFRKREIPCDALYLDIDHMRGYRVFTFGSNYLKPREMVKKLTKKGFKVVAIADPGVKNDPTYSLLKSGTKKGCFVRSTAGTRDYIGSVWPGKSRFPDFTNQKVRDWWGAEQAKFQKSHGIAGIWNDMNEPANFETESKTLDETSRHESDFGPKTHGEIHNIYGLQMARASQEGALRANPRQRPFIISRAAYAGIQRHAIVWTGDNGSWWEHLADSVQMLLNLSLSGVPFCGADAGGFLDNATGELLARWMQLAAFTPFFRNHSNKGTISQEPWSFGPKIEAICRHYIQLRYQLWPYFYSLFEQASRDGTPIMRPMAWHYQNDPVAVAFGDQFLVGEFLLVAPILQQGQTTRQVYLPQGRWYNLWTGQEFSGHQYVLAEAGLEWIPIFVRSGSLIPFAPARANLDGEAEPVITLHVWPGQSGCLNWYEDDGTSNDYQQGDFLRRTIRWEETEKSKWLVFTACEGHYQSAVQSWRVILHSAKHPVRVKIEDYEIPSLFEAGHGFIVFDLGNPTAEMKVKIHGSRGA